MLSYFTPEARAAIERAAAQHVSRAECEAYVELALLAGRWRKANTAERVANSLQREGGLPFTKS